MGALVEVKHNRTLKAFYESLIAAGKAKMVALIAVARKRLTILNAILRDGEPPCNGASTAAGSINDRVSGPAQTVSSATHGRFSATNEEAVHEQVYPNWCGFRQEPLSGSCARGRGERRGEAQIEPVEDASIFHPERAAPGRHGGLRLSALLGAN
jgi:hypothetical protein